MSEIASFDRGKTESALWARAEEAHRRGHLEAALSGYATLARGRLVAGESLPPYLLDRLAAACAEIGELGPAALVLEAAREQALTAGDDYGAARMSLRLAKVALEAGDVARAGEHLRRALGLTVEGDDPSEILGRITALAWADHGPSDAAMGRVDAALTAARLWSTQGRYLPAIRATELALRLLPGAEAFFDRGGIKLSLAELHLETGDLKKARSIESSARPAHENDTSEAAGEARWRLFSARRACLEGRLSEARHALTREAEDSRAPFTRLDFQAAWMLAGLLGRMNRIHEAEEILARARARCGPSPAHARFRQRLNDLSGRLREKRDGVSRVMELPFVPEQAFESAEAPAQERASTSEPGARRGRRDAAGDRLFDAWTAEANRTLAALARGDVGGVTEALDALRGLAARTDAGRIHTRTRYFEALVLHHGGDHRRALGALEGCVEEARDAGLALDELEYLELLAEVTAGLGSFPDYQERAMEAKRRFDRMAGGLDEDDRVYLSLNRSSQVDRFVEASVAATARERSRFPLRRVAVFLDETRRRSATLRVYRQMGRLVGRRLAEKLAPSAGDGRRAPALEDDYGSSMEQVEAWVGAQIELDRRTPFRGPRQAFAERLFALRRIPRSVAVVQFYCARASLHVFVAQRGDIRVLTVPTTRIEVNEAALGALRALREDLDFPDGGLDAALRRLADDIGLAPVLATLRQEVDHLVIVPHDVLVHVPFAALPTGAGDERLCERHVLSHAPDARWIDLRAAASHGSASPKSFLGVAVSTAPGTDLPDLVTANDEIGVAAGVLLGEARPALLCEREASVEAVRAALGCVEWAHFACHGVFDRTNPHLSRLLVHGDAQAAGALTLLDVQTLPLQKLGMVVLGSCWAGSAAVLPGGEPICQPAAFLRAGAGAVLSPTYAVDDTMSLEFMRCFYAEAERCGTAKALSLVQRSWLRSGDEERSRPFHWAAYQHHGQGRSPRAGSARGGAETR